MDPMPGLLQRSLGNGEQLGRYRGELITVKEYTKYSLSAVPREKKNNERKMK